MVIKMLEDKKIRGYKLSSCPCENNAIIGDGPCQEESNLLSSYRTKWIKVKHLNVGMEIATVGTDNQLSWQKIERIEKSRPRASHDIEVEAPTTLLAME